MSHRRFRPRFDRLEVRALPAPLTTFLTTEHVDLNITADGTVAGFDVGPRVEGTPAVQYAHDQALLYIGKDAKESRPSGTNYDFIGVAAGANYYHLPQSQVANLLYLGVAGYGVTPGAFDRYDPNVESGGRASGTARWLKLSLVSVTGPGQFSAWQDSGGGPVVFMSSADNGITSDDALWIVGGGHTHFDLGFTAKGRYEIEYRVSGYLENGDPATLGTYVQSDPIKLYYSVGNVGQFVVNPASYTVDEAAGTATVSIRRTGGSDGQVTVGYSTADGTALAGSDYTATSGTVTFADQQTTATVNIPIINDATQEGDESFTFMLGNPGPTSIADYTKNIELNSMLGATTVATITIPANDVPGPNTPPTISSVANQTTLEDTAKAVSFAVGDAETPAGSLLVSATSSNPGLIPNHASNLIFGGSGVNRTLTLTPLANANGTADITITVTDGGSLSTSKTFTLTVTAVNDPPTISTLGPVGTLEDTPVTVNFSLADDETAPGSLVVAATSSNAALLPNLPANMTLGGSGANRTLTLTPAANVTGTSTITLTVTDGGSLTSTQSFTLTVSAVNDAPTISAVGLQSTLEDTAKLVSFTVGDIDSSTAALIVTATSSNPAVVPNLPANLVVGGSGANRTITITPLADANGFADITLTVSDGSQTSSTTFMLTVTAVNDSPTISAIANQTLLEDGTLTVNFTVNDVDTPQNSLILSRDTGNSTLFPLTRLTLGGNGANRTLTLRPGDDAFGSGTVTVAVSDGVMAVSRTFNVTVTSVYDAPHTQPDNLFAVRNTTSTLDVLGNDSAIEPGQTFVLQSFTQPTNGTVIPGPANTVRYTPVTGFIGADSFTYSAVDNKGVTATETAYVTVGPYFLVDSPTDAQHTDIFVNFVNGEWQSNIRTDAAFGPGGTLGYAFNSTILDSDEGLFFADPSTQQPRAANGTFNFDFLGVNAGENIWVMPSTPVGHQLYLGFSTQRTPVGTFQAYTSADSRVAGQTAGWIVLNVVGVTGPGNFSVYDFGGPAGSPRVWIDTADGINSASDATAGGNSTDAFWALEGTHAHENWAFTAAGRYDVQLQATARRPDGAGGFVSVVGPVTTYHFDVNSQTAPNTRLSENPPTPAADFRTIAEDAAPVAINVLANDSGSPDPFEQLTVTAVNQGANGIVTFTPTGVTYTPRPNFHGNDSFTYTLTDEHGGTAMATVGMMITAINDAPDALADNFGVTPGNTLKGNVLFNDSDVDGDILTVSVATGGNPLHGSLALATNGSFVYTPNASFAGNDAFTYMLSDGQGGTDTALVSIAGRPVDPNFVAIIAQGHTDVGIAYANGQWEPHVHDETNDIEYAPPEQVGLYVRPVGAYLRPATSDFDFLGVPAGASLYRLPEQQNAKLILLGYGAEEIPDGLFGENKITIRVLSVDGPGAVSIWHDTANGPRVTAASADGITTSDDYAFTTGGHEDFNWGFTAHGLYAVTYQFSAFLDNDASGSFDPAMDTFIQSDPATYYFGVDPANAAPVIAAPSTLSTALNTSIAFTGSKSVSISDATLNNDPLTVKLTPASGTVSIPTVTGITFVTGSGTNDAILEIRGTAADLNAALAGLTYKPSTAFSGKTTLMIETTDSGYLVGENVATTPRTVALSVAVPSIVVVGGGSLGRVQIRNADGTIQSTLQPFGAGFTGGIRVAQGDVNGDGVPDIIVATGPGTKAQALVLDGVTQKTLFSVEPFGNFTRGIFVTAGDVTGDGLADIVMSPDTGGGPRVQIRRGGDFSTVSDFFGIDDVNFRGGARTTIGDLDGDGRADLTVSAGQGGGPRIAIFNGKTLSLTGGPKFAGDFFAFEPTLRNGAYVAVGDVNGDGIGDLIAGAGPGGGPRVTIYDGADILAGKGNKSARLADFFAGDSKNRSGVRVAAVDLDGDGLNELVTGSGGGAGHVVNYRIASPAAPQLLQDFVPFADDFGGVYVG